jgi:hypothetical protein
VGYSAILPTGDELSLGAPLVVAQISPVATSGWYYISGSVLVYLDTTFDVNVSCFDNLSNGRISQLSGGTTSISGFVTVSLTDALFINAGDYVTLWCQGQIDSPVSFVENAGLTAILINNAVDGKQARHSRLHHAPVMPGAVK